MQNAFDCLSCLPPFTIVFALQFFNWSTLVASPPSRVKFDYTHHISAAHHKIERSSGWLEIGGNFSSISSTDAPQKSPVSRPSHLTRVKRVNRVKNASFSCPDAHDGWRKWVNLPVKLKTWNKMRIAGFHFKSFSATTTRYNCQLSFTFFFCFFRLF